MSSMESRIEICGYIPFLDAANVDEAYSYFTKYLGESDNVYRHLDGSIEWFYYDQLTINVPHTDGSRTCRVRVVKLDERWGVAIVFQQETDTNNGGFLEYSMTPEDFSLACETLRQTFPEVRNICFNVFRWYNGTDAPQTISTPDGMLVFP